MASTSKSSAKMSQYFSRLNPVPTFPEYTGPYKVGTVDVEIPVDDLSSPSVPPDNAADISTIQFRVFYPAVDESCEKRIWWLPNPQRHHVSAYTRFVGVGNTLAEVLSFFPRHLNYTSIPAHKNATMREPNTENQRWPTMIFSHGLGGSRNSYSYIAGSLASHGVVVVCPEHRDGSAVTSFIRTPGKDVSSWRSSVGPRRIVSYTKISHDFSPDIYEAREAQLRIRLWEMGLVHEAVQAMDRGTEFRNLNVTTPSLGQFASRLNVHEPGSIIFAGHSFGAATINQFLKSTYYADDADVANMEKPLFVPAEGSEIRRQITARTVTMLLDMWCMPLMAPNSKPLFNLPLPAYDDVPSAAGGTALLLVESESFYKWSDHLQLSARLLSPDPSAERVLPMVYERPSGVKQAEPNFFYVLQLLRVNGIPVARTYAGDLVDGTHFDKLELSKKEEENTHAVDGLDDDEAIFDRSGSNIVDHWHWINTIGLGQPTDEEGNNKGKSVVEGAEDTEWEIKGELGPSDDAAQTTCEGHIAKSVSPASRTIQSVAQTV
ncbi:platelet-activating factor acetylhydrolase [Geosmithia morbida]|uniref:Putative phospholipase n=1 Tax=Geosmithia morbida TaxID=1094350 RepID=A0A9P4YQ84_9HYPO|nr:platelet-activating factor acetylhydrolase [Geosmithia morbida]KAF4120750.1 platelet-activating factor acetylhydrolase [Geosmithia morbida]